MLRFTPAGDFSVRPLNAQYLFDDSKELVSDIGQGIHPLLEMVDDWRAFLSADVPLRMLEPKGLVIVSVGTSPYVK